MRFSVIIATCNRPARLARTLDALKASIERAEGRHAVIIVDNSLDRSARELAVEFKNSSGINVAYLESEPRNKARALNAGIRSAKNDWLAFTDDDALPDRNWLRNAGEYLTGTGHNIFGGRVVAGEGDGPLPAWLRAGRSGRRPRGPAVVDYSPLTATGGLNGQQPVPLGSNVFVHKSIFDKYGGYDEDLWKRCGTAALGCEDAEFAMRVRSSGEQIGYCAEAMVVHPVYADRASIRNHVVWAWRNGIREAILFRDKTSSGTRKLRLLRYSAASFLRAFLLLARCDCAASLCELMIGVQGLGTMRGYRMGCGS